MLAACGVAAATDFAATALAHRVYIVFDVASGGAAGIVVVGVVDFSVCVVDGLAAAAAAAVDVVGGAVVVDVDVAVDSDGITVAIVIHFFVACFNSYEQVQPLLFIQHATRAGTKQSVVGTLRPPCQHAASRRYGWELLASFAE